MASGSEVRAQVTTVTDVPLTTVTEPLELNSTQEIKPKPQRSKRPNYAQIHAKPLPLEVYPLPAFIPHNPLSVVRIVVALISHSIWPPSAHVIVHKAYFSPETQSIHVTDPESVRALWEQGFWGAGSLSRSEPRWLDLEKRKRGIQAMQTSEEVTANRRKERRQFKLERARLEREAIEEQRRAEGRTDLMNATEQRRSDVEPSASLNDKLPSENLDGTSVELKNGAANAGDSSTFSLPVVPDEQHAGRGLASDELLEMVEDQEHLQLTLEEAFFLTYALGALSVHKDDNILPASLLLRLYCSYSSFPIPETAERQFHWLRYRQNLSHVSSITASNALPIAPDNTFLLKYVVFHHFRSLGWVVRPGIKFAVDYLLYNRGPAFAHAEFAIMIIPAYSHSYWSESSERKRECEKKEGRDWWWLHRINRVQSQVHKTLVLVYVEIPPPWDVGHRDTGFEVDVGTVLKKYQVREFVLRRWAPNRQRD